MEKSKAFLLGPDQNIEVDLAVLGTRDFTWPGSSLVLHDLIQSLSRFLAVTFLESPTPGNRALFLKKGFYLGVATWLYYRHAQNCLKKTAIPGLRLINHGSTPVMVHGRNLLFSRFDKSSPLKKSVARLGQIALLRLIDLLHLPRPLVCLNNLRIPNDVPCVWTWRVRNPYSFMERSQPLSREESQSVLTALEGLSTFLEGLCNQYGLMVSRQDLQPLLATFIHPQLEGALRDFNHMMKIFRGRPMDCFLGSLSPYSAGLLAMACKENGGKVHASEHADYHFRIVNMLILVDLINADTFHCGTPVRARRLREASERHPLTFTCDIRWLHEDRQDDFTPMAPPWSGTNKTIMVMGIICNPENPRGNLALLPILDFEVRLCHSLLAWGYRVIYKVHPESTWNGHEELFGPEVRVERAPFEKVWSQADAYTILLAQSTTTMLIWRTDRPVYLFWQAHLEPFDADSITNIQRRCEVIPGEFDAANRIQIDFDRLQTRLKDPKPWDRESARELSN
ncbi:MAG: hypothetical protein HQL63_13310 [Magnetococcales bacterium]|nr:hypothetical protein [Magnetococcales bacterium]MBF0322728.1 hypothetical protein [Magnetococcales bacterium]